MKEIKTYYWRNLPHIHPIGATFFVTFRLYGSIPLIKLIELREEYESEVLNIKLSKNGKQQDLIEEAQKRHFVKYYALLDAMLEGPDYLKMSGVADLIKSELHRYDNKHYDLLAYCIMPNHVHSLIDTGLQLSEDLSSLGLEEINYVPLSRIMKNIKGVTAVYCNRYLSRSGKFWQRESYDHYVRNEQSLERIVAYILNNPVKARLVNHWEEWPYSYLRW